MNAPLVWFRLYTEIVDDEKLRLLAFEDRWHFIALLCCKGKGILDEKNQELARRKVAVKLGLDMRTLDEVARRLAEVELINETTLQPLAWNNRQFTSDQDPTNKERQQKYREKQRERKHNGRVTDESRTNNAAKRTETETETEEEEEVVGDSVRDGCAAENPSSSPSSPERSSSVRESRTAESGLAPEALLEVWNHVNPERALRSLPPKRKQSVGTTLAFVDSNLGQPDWPKDRADIPAWFADLFRYARDHEGYLRERDFGFFMDPDRLSSTVEGGYEPRS